MDFNNLVELHKTSIHWESLIYTQNEIQIFALGVIIGILAVDF